MSRIAVVFMLLLAMLWQSVAMARAGSSVNVLTDPVHAALHWNGEGHFHHGDGTYHVDLAEDSAEADEHVLVDHVAASVALLNARAQDLLVLGSMRPVVAPLVPWPDRVVDGLLRPPRATL